MFQQLVAAGIVSGSIYALVGLGLTIGYKATDIITFAQGAIVMLGAYFCVIAAASYGVPYFWACLLAVAVVAAIGWLADWIVYQRLLDATHITQVLATLGVANVIKGSIVLIWETKSYGFPPSPRMQPVLTTPVVLNGQQVLVVIFGIAAVTLLTVFFKYTRWGKAMRALSQNRMGANLCGIRTSRVFSLANIIAAVFGALAGVLYAPLTLVDTSFDWLLVKGFAAAAIGGLTSIPGTVVGGLLLGLSESLWVSVMPALWSPLLGYLLITIVLLVKPAGIFGGSTSQKL